jgi:hypothetical protein
MNARLAYYFKIDASELTDEEYAIKWAQIDFVLSEEAKRWQLKK